MKQQPIDKILKDLNGVRKEDLYLYGFGTESSVCSKLFQTAYYNKMKTLRESNEINKNEIKKYREKYMEAWNGKLEEAA